MTHSMGVDKFAMTCAHHYRVIQALSLLPPTTADLFPDSLILPFPECLAALESYSMQPLQTGFLSLE